MWCGSSLSRLSRNWIAQIHDESEDAAAYSPVRRVSDKLRRTGAMRCGMAMAKGAGIFARSIIRRAAVFSGLRAGAGFQGRVARDEMGIVTLSGRCEDTAKLAPFLEQLEQSDIAYQNQTVCADELRRSVAWVLHRNGYPNARVESGATPDAVVI